MSADAHPNAPTPDADRPRFALASHLGPAILAGTPYRVGDHLRHATHGRLEVRGFGETNGARGAFVILRPPGEGPDADGDAPPARWSFDRGTRYSLPDAYAAGDLTLTGGCDGGD